VGKINKRKKSRQADEWEARPPRIDTASFGKNLPVSTKKEEKPANPPFEGMAEKLPRTLSSTSADRTGGSSRRHPTEKGENRRRQSLEKVLAKKGSDLGGGGGGGVGGGGLGGVWCGLGLVFGGGGGGVWGVFGGGCFGGGGGGLIGQVVPRLFNSERKRFPRKGVVEKTVMSPTKKKAQVQAQQKKNLEKKMAC